MNTSDPLKRAQNWLDHFLDSSCEIVVVKDSLRERISSFCCLWRVQHSTHQTSIPGQGEHLPEIWISKSCSTCGISIKPFTQAYFDQHGIRAYKIKEFYQLLVPFDDKRNDLLTAVLEMGITSQMQQKRYANGDMLVSLPKTEALVGEGTALHYMRDTLTRLRINCSIDVVQERIDSFREEQYHF
ncbi:MAG: hypothetical protein AAFY71_18540 [Bacteroidota bacterium]